MNYVAKGGLLSTIFALTTILSRGLVFMCLPLFLRSISIEAFGLYDFYHLLTINIAVLLSNSAINSLNRFYESHDPLKVLGNCLAMLSLQTIGFGAWALAIHASNPLFALCLVNSILFAWFSFILAYYRLTFHIKRYLAVFGIQTGIYLCTTWFLLFYVHAGIYALWYGFTLSLLSTLPWLIILFGKQLRLDWTLLKQQLTYCAPLLFFTALYVSFFSIDRFIIKYYLDEHALGIYGLLWRFGSLFQLGAFALYDAWPAIVFPAHKEYGNEYIANLVFYYLITLATISLGALACTPLAITLLFPAYASECIPLVSLFFAALFFLECSRLNQIGCLLSKQTKLIPVLTLGAMALQILILIGAASYHVLTVRNLIYLNCLVYGMYCISNRMLSTHLYTCNLFGYRYTVAFIVYVGAIISSQFISPITFIGIGMPLWLTTIYLLLNNDEKIGLQRTFSYYLKKHPTY